MLLNRSEKPPAPVPQEPALAVNGDEIVIQRNERRYRIRGLLKNLSPEVMKVNVLVSRGSDSGAEFHVDTLDMQTDRQRAAFIKRAAEELGLNEIRRSDTLAYTRNVRPYSTSNSALREIELPPESTAFNSTW